MKLDELLDRARYVANERCFSRINPCTFLTKTHESRDLAFLKEHPVWDAAVREAPPPTATREEKKRQKVREELASWCRCGFPLIYLIFCCFSIVFRPSWFHFDSDWRMEYREEEEVSEREVPQRRPRARDIAEETEVKNDAFCI